MTCYIWLEISLFSITLEQWDLSRCEEWINDQSLPSRSSKFRKELLTNKWWLSNILIIDRVRVTRRELWECKAGGWSRESEKPKRRNYSWLFLTVIFRDYPDDPACRIHIPIQESWVPSLVRELRSHASEQLSLCSTTNEDPVKPKINK